MIAEHECVFVEEQEPSGRLILPPCLVCGITAMDALAEMELRLGVEQRHAEAAIAVTRKWRADKGEAQEALATLKAVSSVMARDLAILYAAGHGESEGLKAYREMEVP